MAIAFPLSEGDLHGLVDGKLEPNRRADALRALAASPADRAKVEAWQEQNDLIRSTFSDVETEPLPIAMRLVAPPALHCVPRPETTLSAPTHAQPGRRSLLVGIALASLVVCGLGVSWMLLQQVDEPPQVVDIELRKPSDVSLAAVASEAVADDLGHGASQAAPKPSTAPTALPTTSIPDLSPAGFVFTHADSRLRAPTSLVFHYRDAEAEHVVISVARTPTDVEDGPPAAVGHSLIWRHGSVAYAVAGTVAPERLRAIVTLLKGSTLEE